MSSQMKYYVVALIFKTKSHISLQIWIQITRHIYAASQVQKKMFHVRIEHLLRDKSLQNTTPPVVSST